MYTIYGIFTLFCLLIVTVWSSFENERIVETTYGAISGRLVKTRASDAEKSNAAVFLGVPFAKPPIGDLRFEEPVEPERWQGVREAKNFAKGCFPLVRSSMYAPLAGKEAQESYDEDCLYLNVFAPQWKSDENDGGFPVLFFVHGGGFEVGSTHEFGYKFFVENYLPHDVIVITAQYRLAQFGFVTLEDESFPGNYGLWDLVAALKFVQQNVARFGGDPTKITIFGHSAGGAAVGHLSHTSHANGLFANAIQMSGSAFAEWANTPRPTASRLLASALNCLDENGRVDAKTVKECMKRKKTSEFFDAVEKIRGHRMHDINFLIFTPTIDGKFHAHNNFSDLLRKAPKKPTLIGVADAEALEFTIIGAIKDLASLYVPPSEYAQFGEQKLKDFITNYIATIEKTGSAQAAKELASKIFDFYVRDAKRHEPPPTPSSGASSKQNDEADGADYKFYLKQYTKIISDVMFLVPALIDAEAKAEAGWPVYLYRFGYYNRDMIHDELRPVFTTATHAGEYPYVFGLFYEIKATKFTPQDVAFQANFIEMMIAFAKNGNPTTASLHERGDKWPALNENNRTPPAFEHVEVGPEMRVRDEKIGLFTETLKFWREIRAQYDVPEVHHFSPTVPRTHSRVDEL